MRLCSACVVVIAVGGVGLIIPRVPSSLLQGWAEDAGDGRCVEDGESACDTWLDTSADLSEVILACSGDLSGESEFSGNRYR